MGPVVAIDEYRGRRVFTVDDSSGKCIEAWVNITIPTPECNASDPMEAQSGKTTTGNVGRAGILQAQDSTGPYNEIDVGDIADVKGSISLFMTEKQIKVEKMMIVKSTTLEVALWRKRSTFHRDILDKPWILRQKDIRRCRRAAETSEEGLKQQKQNKKPLKAATTACASTETRRTQPLIANTPRESTRYRSKDKSKPVDVTERLRDLIRDGSVKGKYSALGL
ncbi:hypothetical protein QQS21_006838 [Conoideocrella luteorostrata]|uniref:Uncharacterized protein n=1 Tax=Conoideocrella luteorostrata TaxID=1105319 RepID=A0AAJ0CP61_9HYPO|nr:hypothetical protein QQS21_006838 [Conoideocrella luteorostrata]